MREITALWHVLDVYRARRRIERGVAYAAAVLLAAAVREQADQISELCAR